MKKTNVGILVCAVAVWGMITPVSAAPLYGVSASGQANYTLPSATGTPVTTTNSYTTGTVLQQTAYSQPSNYGGQGTVTIGTATDSASAYVVQQYSSYSQLHEAISASSNIPSGTGGATSSAFLSWQDTISFAGAAAGTPVTIQLTNTFNGSFTTTGSVATGTGLGESALLFNNAGNIDLTNNYTTSQPNLNVTQTGLLTTTVGSVLTLQEQLNEYLSGTQTFSGNIDFADTSNVYLTILTPGITLTSASGETYNLPGPATPTATPEPSYAFIAAGGIMALYFIRRKRLVATN